MTDIRQWHDPDSPLRIEYAGDAMERIRQRALDGVKALPRTGLAVGGLLLGERAGARVRILDTAELPCSHAFGPSFLLTPHEKAQGRELVETTEDLAVVGWYCTRPRGELQLADADLALYRELFPAQWQITLILQARLEGPARAVFLFPGKSGELTRGAERDLGTWVPGSAREDSAELRQWEPIPAVALTATDEKTGAERTGDEKTGDEKAEPPRSAGKPGWVISWVLTAIAALAVGAAIFEVQTTWLTESPVQTQAPAQIP